MITLDDEGIKIEEEDADIALNMMFEGLELVAEKFIQAHPKHCTECPAYKFAHRIEWTLKELKAEAISDGLATKEDRGSIRDRRNHIRGNAQSPEAPSKD